MRPPHELDRVRWRKLTHAYGSAEDLPGMLRGLYGDEEAVGEALFELNGAFQGDTPGYASSAVQAVPFLAHAALHSPSRQRDGALMLLALFAEPHEDAAVRAAVAREVEGLLPCLRDPAPAVRRAALRLPAAAADLLAPQVRESALAEADALYAADPVVPIRADALALRVLLGRTGALPLDSPQPPIRLAAAILTAMTSGPPYAPEVVRIFAEAEPEQGYEDDGEYGEYGEGDSAAADLADLWAEATEGPYDPSYAEEEAEEQAEDADGAPGSYEADDAPGASRGDRLVADFPWPGTDLPGTQVSALGDVLAADPDATFEVAARWIADGDEERRGSNLAENVLHEWRDREPAFLALALDALPHARHPGELANRIGAVTRWVALDPAPGVRLRDTLHAHASGAEDQPAREALLALVRARDPRALDLLPERPGPAALRAAAVHFPAQSARLVPVLRRELAAPKLWGGDAVILVEALAALGPAAVREAQEELTGCLREDRAGLTAARTLGDAGAGSPEVLGLLRMALHHRDTRMRATAAVAYSRLTGEPAAAVNVLAPLLASPGEAPLHLPLIEALGPAASRLLPRVESLLREPYEPTRVAAAAATFWLTGDPARATPVLTAAVAPTPTGLKALKALAAMGPAPAELHPALTEFATSPRRQLGPSTAEEPHPDVQLRDLARRLLAAS
ncbi:hypothetical protein [Streptomyces sp. NRRL F-5123]|uniref:hypothetical protein n=1 Tax=Streptomyces sp. NRRL F-5123 TaxID=1463856 RepID=UPI0004E23B4E|nr:hypothetical protein [Streptomyces sp. NRRL F-5123]